MHESCHHDDSIWEIRAKAFQRLLNLLFAEMQPGNVFERFYLERVVLSFWRTQRAYELEAAAIRNSSDPASLLPDIQCLPKIVRYENMIDRQLQHALTAVSRSRKIPVERLLRAAPEFQANP